MSQLGTAAQFAAGLYRQQLRTAYRGYVQKRPLAQLQLAPGRRDPYPIYERIRAQGPLWQTPAGHWVTTSHAVCTQVLRDRRLGVRPFDAPSGLSAEEDFSFLGLNPPDHTRLRRLATPAFGPAAVAGYRPRVEKTVNRFVDKLRGQGGGDLVSGFASPLPIAVITDLLGVPESMSTEFARYGSAIGSSLDGVRSLAHARVLKQSHAALARIFADLFELKRHQPADDVVSQLVAAEGDLVQPEEMLPLCLLLLVAGFETTVNLIGNGVIALLDGPGQWDALRADPGLAARTTEEVLRYDPPVQRTNRVALQDVEIAGQLVRRGSWLVVLLGGANRDPGVFDQPGCFDISRGSAEHLAFSSGIHHCLGQALARLEATVAFEALAQRLPDLARAGPAKRRPTVTIRGPLTLPVKLSRP